MGNKDLPFGRILLKLSGEALLGQEEYGIDPEVLGRIAADIRDIHERGVEIGVVIGGGNIFRGAGLARAGMDRVTGDHMGMLATVINSLAMQDGLERLGVQARVSPPPPPTRRSAPRRNRPSSSPRPPRPRCSGR